MRNTCSYSELSGSTSGSGAAVALGGVGFCKLEPLSSAPLEAEPRREWPSSQCLGLVSSGSSEILNKSIR